MEDEYVRRICQQRETKAFPNPWLWTTGQKKLDLRDLGYESAEDGQDGRSRLLVLAFVQSVDHDHHRNGGLLEGSDDQLCHLVVQGLFGNSWIQLHRRDEVGSKFCVPACELNGQGGEYELEVAPILEVSRTEERGTEPPVCEESLRDRLRDGGLPRPSQAIQPVDGGLVKVPCPEFDLAQDSSTCPLQATIAVAVSILDILRAVDISENSCFNCRRFMLNILCQEWLIFSDLDSTEGYWIYLDAKGKYSLCARPPPFGVSSVALVNTDEGITWGSWPNLVIEDGLPYIFEEPGNLFIVLDLIGKFPQLRVLSQRPQLCFDVCELAGRNSAPSPRDG